jgi:hypothetical protein
MIYFHGGFSTSILPEGKSYKVRSNDVWIRLMLWYFVKNNGGLQEILQYIIWKIWCILAEVKLLLIIFWGNNGIIGFTQQKCLMTNSNGKDMQIVCSRFSDETRFILAAVAWTNLEFEPPYKPLKIINVIL